ncbi:hypothetical protein KM043_016367 [Ampulex compressa]|nr:hypothetical protein KM043_016367 [Ampulex compressa]
MKLPVERERHGIPRDFREKVTADSVLPEGQGRFFVNAATELQLRFPSRFSPSDMEVAESLIHPRLQSAATFWSVGGTKLMGIHGFNRVFFFVFQVLSDLRACLGALAVYNYEFGVKCEGGHIARNNRGNFGG